MIPTRRSLAIAMGLLVLCCRSELTAQVPQAVPLEIVVNTQDVGGHIVTLTEDGDVLVPVDALEPTGLQLPPGRVDVDGMAHVSLRALGAGLRYKLDLNELVLTVTAEPALFRHQTVDLAEAPPADIVYTRGNSAYLNYSVSYFKIDGEDSGVLSVPWELVARVGDTLAASSFSHEKTPTKQHSVRMLSNLTWDRVDARVRTVLGDFVAGSDPLAGGGTFGGLKVATEFSLTPYFVPYPGAEVRGVLTSPSQVDIYAGGQRVGTQQLKPGEFRLVDVPYALGGGQIVLEIKDAFGRTQRIEAPYYVSSRLLRPGLHDFSYAFGSRRELLGAESNEYGNATLLGSHRYGFSDWLTASLRGEADRDVVNLGAGLTTVPWRTGELDALVAASREGEARGSAVRLQYRYSMAGFGLNLAAARFSEDYATISSPATADKSSRFWSVGLGLARPWLGSLSLGYSQDDRYFSADRSTASVFYSLSLSTSASMVAGFTQTVEETEKEKTPSNLFFAGLVVVLGSQHSASLNHQDSDGTRTTSASFQRSLPQGVGLGYGLRVDRTNASKENDGIGGSASVEYNAPFGYYSLYHTRHRELGITTYTAAGTLAYLGGSVNPGRPILDSFALVRVDDLEDVRIYTSNQEVGTTDGSGELLVTGLHSYVGNLIAIEQQDVPIDYSLTEVRRNIAPPYRGGALVTFEATRFKAFSGVAFFLVQGERVPAELAGLELEIEGRTVELTVGRGGEFYGENLPTGTFPARLFADGRECRFQLTVPESDETLVDLGEVACEVE